MKLLNVTVVINFLLDDIKFDGYLLYLSLCEDINLSSNLVESSTLTACTIKLVGLYKK